jgi:peptidyl-prolyl cis-trans isomerase D
MENTPVEPDRSTFVWYEVTAVNAEHDRTLAEVRPRVVEAWKKAETEKKLTDRANAIRDRLAKGEDIATVAAAEGLTVKTAAKVTRQSRPEGDHADVPQAAMSGAFGGPKGYAAAVSGPDDSKIVLVVTATNLPAYFSDAPELAQVKEQFGTQVANDYIGQYLGQLQGQIGVSVNQAVLQQALGPQPQQPGI